jgi:hypothetical protein
VELSGFELFDERLFGLVKVTEVFSSVLWMLEAVSRVRSVWALARSLVPVRFSETVTVRLSPAATRTV